MTISLDDQSKASEDEGDAEELSHVHPPAGDELLLPSLLHVLDALYEEARTKDPAEELPYDEPRVATGSISAPIEVAAEGKD